MARATATAAILGLITGIAIGLPMTAPDQVDVGMVLLLAVNIAPIVVCSIVVVGTIRHLLTRHRAATRAELVAAAEEREIFLAEIAARQADVARREEALSLASTTSEARISDVLKTLLEEQEATKELQREYDELVTDYNRVVRDSIQQAAHLFRPRPTRNTDWPGAYIPMPTRTRSTDDAVQPRVRDVADGAMPPAPTGL